MFFVEWGSQFFSGFIAGNGKAYFVTEDISHLIYDHRSQIARPAFCQFLGNCQAMDVTGYRDQYLSRGEWVVEHNALLHYLIAITRNEQQGDHTAQVALLDFLVNGTVRVQRQREANLTDLVEDPTSQLKFAVWLEQQQQQQQSTSS